MNAITPSRCICGISIHLLLNPRKLNASILKSLTNSVTIYKTTAEDIHRKIPNVIKLSGNNNRLIMGLAIRDAIVRPIPERTRVVV